VGTLGIPSKSAPGIRPDEDLAVCEFVPLPSPVGLLVLEVKLDLGNEGIEKLLGLRWTSLPESLSQALESLDRPVNLRSIFPVSARLPARVSLQLNPEPFSLGA